MRSCIIKLCQLCLQQCITVCILKLNIMYHITIHHHHQRGLVGTPLTVVVCSIIMETAEQVRLILLDSSLY